MKVKMIYLLLIVAIVTGSCKKEKLTKETQVGANTFSCKINGKVYKAKNDLFSKGLIVILFKGNSPNTYDLGLEGVMYNGTNSDYTIDIDLFELEAVKVYELFNTNIKVKIFDRHSNNYHSNNGRLVITKFDLTDRILSGNFEFILINEKDSNDKIIITDGRFDLAY